MFRHVARERGSPSSRTFPGAWHGPDNSDTLFRPKRNHDLKLCADKKPILVRTNDAATWLWRKVPMDNQSTSTITDVVPDTFSSWYVTGFALSPALGLGLMNAPQKFTAGKLFYIVAHLPYSIKLNEVIRIEVTLYNFLDTSLATEVTLFNQYKDFEFVDQVSTDSTHCRKVVVVPVHKATSISFMVKAKKLGNIAIKMEATNREAFDRAESTLRVIHEGELISESEARFFDLYPRGTKTISSSIGIPKDTELAEIEIDILLSSVFTSIDLRSLNDIPTKTSHSNPLTFIPKVALLDYLMETNLTSTQTLQKSIDIAYTNLLKHRHSSGAFGQWRSPRGKPSIYLTALVVNSLGIASNYIDVDEMAITRALSWISKKQRSNGCFEEDGEMVLSHVHDMLTPSTLTAFILATIKENKPQIASQFDELVVRATYCLANNFNSLNSTHDIALATYALALTEHANRHEFLNELTDTFNENSISSYRNDELNVEIAGYTILSSLALGSYFDAYPLMEWLNSQHYSIEGFDHLHSTFIALKSLGKMAAYANTRSANFEVIIKYGEDMRKTSIDGLDLVDKQLNIRYLIPGHIRAVELSVTGVGLGMIQMTLQCRKNIQSTTASFDVDVTVLGSSDYDTQDLQVCLNYIQTKAVKVPGVTLVEVYLPSGLVFLNDTVRDLSLRVQKTERALGDTAMFVYYDDLDVDRVCFEVTAHRKFKIANQQAAYVAVHEINDGHGKSIRTYMGAISSVCEICDDENCKSINCQK